MAQESLSSTCCRSCEDPYKSDWLVSSIIGTHLGTSEQKLGPV